MLGFESALNRKLVIATIAVSSFFSILISSAQIYHSWKDQEQQLVDEVDSLVKSVIPSLERSVWYLDKVQTKANLQVIAVKAGVVKVEVYLTDLSELFVSTSAGSHSIAVVESWAITRKNDPGVPDSELGRIKVYLSHETLIQSVVHQAKFIFVTNAVKVILLSWDC